MKILLSHIHIYYKVYCYKYGIGSHDILHVISRIYILHITYITHIAAFRSNEDRLYIKYMSTPFYTILMLWFNLP